MDEPVRDDAAHLKSLRVAAGLDVAELAAKVNLSAGQVRQLEDGGESLFYSTAIKKQTLRRVIAVLETPAEAAAEVISMPERDARSGQNVIDDIIRLSEQNLNNHVVTSAVRRPGSSNAKRFLLILIALGLLALLAWQFNRHQSRALYTEWVEPVTAKVLQAPPTGEDLKSQTLQVEVVPAPPAGMTTEVVTAPLPQAPAPVVPVVAAPLAPTVESVPDKSVASNATKLVPDSSLANEDCSKISEAATPIATQIHNKAGTYVHLFSNKSIQVCVDDGKKTHTLVTLAPGIGRSVYGVSPWTIASAEMKSLQIYFQGGKVLLPPDAGARIYLKEQAVSP